MRIQVKGRHVPISDELRDHVAERFRKVAHQVSELAELEVEVWQEHPGKNPECWVVEATLRLKGVTLRACEESPDQNRSVRLCADELGVQVKRHRDKRRARRKGRAGKLAARFGNPAEPAL
jgi:putative sigma-54 modulation protein